MKRAVSTTRTILHTVTATLLTSVLIAGCNSGGGRNSPGSTAGTKDCGDTAGPDGDDVPCACGDRVVANTTLTASDPVTGVQCTGRGLSVASGVTLNLGGFTLNGSGVESGIEALGDAMVANGQVNGFGTGIHVATGVVQLTNIKATGALGAGLVAGAAGGATAPVVSLSGADASVSDSGGTGIHVHPGAQLALDGVSVMGNAGVGIEVHGQLMATNVEVGSSGGHGVLVETAEPVRLESSSIHDNGEAGVYVLAASHADGFVLRGLDSSVSNNGGDGIVLGHVSAQTGIVNAEVADAEITGNQVGIRIAQSDPTNLKTAHRLLANNIYSNAQSGIHIRTSHQWYTDTPDRRAMSSNDVHHNGVQGAGCVVGADVQIASQIIFDGPIATADPAVSSSVPDTGPNPTDYPEDHRCYFGADTSARIQTAEACNSLNDPSGPESDGVNNHCVWNGSQCRIAWQAGGTEELGACGSASNRIFAYVNDPGAPPATQRGIFATGGAYVNARRNWWRLGGIADNVFVDAASGSLVDADNACGTVSSCP